MEQQIERQIERQIVDLTYKLHSKCKGALTPVVVGAALNIIQTALNHSGRDVSVSTAKFLREYADRIEAGTAGERVFHA